MIENTVIRPANQDKYNDVSKKITKVINKSLDVTSTFKEDNQRVKRSIIKTNKQIKKQAECSLKIKNKLSKMNSRLKFYSKVYSVGIVAILLIVANLLSN